MRTLNTTQVLLAVLSVGSLRPADHVVCVECWIITPSRLFGVHWVLDHYPQQIIDKCTNETLIIVPSYLPESAIDCNEHIDGILKDSVWW